MADTINVQPAVVNLELYAGDDWSTPITIDQDISGDTLTASFRLDRTDAASTLDLTVSVTQTTPTGVLTVSATGAQLIALLTNGANLSRRWTGFWDLEWSNGSSPITVVQGGVEVDLDVTRT